MKATAAVILCVSALVGQAISSSIPMWEYLTKDEKMGYLYSMFKNQVDEFCEFSEMDNCKDELTRYGLKRLREMDENSLDEMDPYQRGANSIIWNSMTEGHEMMKTTPPKQQRSTTTSKPNNIDDESFSDNTFGSLGEASAKIDNVYRVPPPKDFVYPNSIQERPFESYQTGNALYVYPKNSISNEKRTTTFVKVPSTTLTPPPLPIRRQQEYQEGPLIVRVYPDGRPVKDPEQNLVPQDEDLRQYMLAKVKLPEY